MVRTVALILVIFAATLVWAGSADGHLKKFCKHTTKYYADGMKRVVWYDNSGQAGTGHFHLYSHQNLTPNGRWIHKHWYWKSCPGVWI